MHFEPNQIYHVYNRGNNKQTTFFNRRNYEYFIKKVEAEWEPFCHLLAYCLMPNHFHFLISPKDAGCLFITVKEKELYLQNLSKSIGKTLSSYTRAVNNERQRCGALFAKKTKAKCIMDDYRYITHCVNYIHENPVESNLVMKEASWEFSSYREYCDPTIRPICNQEMLFQVSGLSSTDFQLPGSFSKPHKHVRPL